MNRLILDDKDTSIRPIIAKDPVWNTNAAFLCNYMKEISFLKDKIRRRALVPRYVQEPVGYLGIPEISRIALPMICFCDIPFSKVRIHISQYGQYGIAFDKSKIIKKGLQPIHYISDESPLRDDFRSAFHCCMNDSIKKELEPLADFPRKLISVYETCI